MNPKAAKLREEREKNREKIAALQARNKKIDAEITAIENTDILGMVHEYGLSPDQLAELLQAMKHEPLPALGDAAEKEEVEN